MLHGLLLANVDTLALESNPASQLPSPNSLDPDLKLQKVVLAWFMALIAEVSVWCLHTLLHASVCMCVCVWFMALSA